MTVESRPKPPPQSSHENPKAQLRRRMKPYAVASNRKALWQLTTTMLALLATSVAAIAFFKAGFYVLTWMLSPIWALLLVRLFVLQHDCGHHSFFSSKKANNLTGFFLSAFTFTPILNWRYSHNLHHGSNGNLDRRGTGDIWIMTATEFAQADKWTRLKYRLYRHPVFLFFVGPFFYFLFRRRFSVHISRTMWRERRDLWLTNLYIVSLYVGLALLIGWRDLVIIMTPVLMMTAGGGVWLFYMQHTFEDTYLKRSKQWDFVDAAIEGSTMYQLPQILHWFTANIGFHHIHHLNSQIPNYHLQKCMAENMDLFANVPVIRLRDSLAISKLKLWDENLGRYIGFEQATR